MKRRDDIDIKTARQTFWFVAFPLCLALAATAFFMIFEGWGR